MASLSKFKITQNHKNSYECQMKVCSKFHFPSSGEKLRYASLTLNNKTFTISHKITRA